MEMISALGHCEDAGCSHLLLNPELVRLFRCSIHCDRLLCLHHLNVHDVYYLEEKKQNEAVFNELQNSLTLYQTIFDQHLQEYRQLVHQASTVLLHNTSTMVPIDQIRPILERIQREMAIFQREKVTIKSELPLDSIEFNIESHLMKEIPSIKKEIASPIKTNVESNRVVIRLERIDCGLSNEQISRKSTDENQQKKNNDARNSLPTLPETKKPKKLYGKKIPLKRLHT